MADLRPCEVRLDLVGVHDALFDLVQHADCLLHVGVVAVGERHGVVDHHQCGGCHQDGCPRHRDDRGRARGDPVDLHGDMSRVLHEHRVDATRCDAVPSGAVDPHRHLAAVGEQLIAELFGGDIIIEPALLGDRARKLKDSRCAFVFALVFPLPELPVLHYSPPGMCPYTCLRMPRPEKGGACFR